MPGAGRALDGRTQPGLVGSVVAGFLARVGVSAPAPPPFSHALSCDQSGTGMAYVSSYRSQGNVMSHVSTGRSPA